MSNPFIEEIINSAHLRLLSPDWQIIKNGYELIDTIEIRVHDNKILKEIETKNNEINKGYLERLKQIESITDPQHKNEERYKTEFARLKEMIRFYDKLKNRIP